jgi:hypothetical protein
MGRMTTSTLLDALESVGDMLIERQLCRTRRDFAREWLSVSDNYLDVMRRKAMVPFEKAARLHFKLLEMHQPDLATELYSALKAEAARQEIDA